jgi:hypothetical protein
MPPWTKKEAAVVYVAAGSHPIVCSDEFEADARS